MKTTGYEFEVRAAAFPHAAPHRPAVGNASPQPTFLPSGRLGSNSCCPGSMPIWNSNLSIKELACCHQRLSPCLPAACSVSISTARPWNICRRNACSWQPKNLFPPSLPVTDIALSCGFSSPSYFTKQFRELIGKYAERISERTKKQLKQPETLSGSLSCFDRRYNHSLSVISETPSQIPGHNPLPRHQLQCPSTIPEFLFRRLPAC